MRCLNGKGAQAIGFKTEILDGQELKKKMSLKYSTVIIIIIDVYIPLCKYNN